MAKCFRGCLRSFGFIPLVIEKLVLVQRRLSVKFSAFTSVLALGNVPRSSQKI